MCVKEASGTSEPDYCMAVFGGSLESFACKLSGSFRGYVCFKKFIVCKRFHKTGTGKDVRCHLNKALQLTDEEAKAWGRKETS